MQPGDVPERSRSTVRRVGVKLALHVLCLNPTVVNVDLAVERVGPGARAPLARYRHHIPLIQRGERSEANLYSHSEESADMWNCTHIQVQCTSTTMQAYYKVIHCRLPKGNECFHAISIDDFQHPMRPPHPPYNAEKSGIFLVANLARRIRWGACN